MKLFAKSFLPENQGPIWVLFIFKHKSRDTATLSVVLNSFDTIFFLEIITLGFKTIDHRPLVDEAMQLNLAKFVYSKKPCCLIWPNLSTLRSHAA